MWPFKKKKEIFKYPPSRGTILFPVIGAGYISMGSHAHDATSYHVGFSFSVSWGRNGYLGGILGREDAIRLANHILEACKDIKESEFDEWEKRFGKGIAATQNTGESQVSKNELDDLMAAWSYCPPNI